MKDSVPQAAKPITSESHDLLANLLTNLGLSFHDVYTIEKKLQVRIIFSIVLFLIESVSWECLTLNLEWIIWVCVYM